jgi:hypothetical protein
VLSFFRFIMDVSLLRPILRPITRFLVSLIAVPIFRSLTRRVLRVETLDAELEKDLEQWFRGAILLLLATQNMESTIFPWVEPVVQARYEKSVEESNSADPAPNVDSTSGETDEQSIAELQVNDNDSGWLLLGLRVMLAIGVIQMMPDQELFAVIHNGPPKIDFDRKRKWLPQIRIQWWSITKGFVCLHLNRSSPVFAILATIAPGGPGWVCYGMALGQYLIIGLVTSRDKALDVLTLFDETMQTQRQHLIDELHIEDKAEVPRPGNNED